jgi:DNA-binding GntR family transcriptional regulator
MFTYTSKSDMVAAMLREMILVGELRPAEHLKQRELASRFGVSETPVREALRRLQAEGLITVDVHRGATVAEAHQGATAENFQIRAALESLGASLAACRITDAELKELEELNARMKDPSSPEGYVALNRTFHFRVYECARSPLLLALMRLLWQSMPRGPQVARSEGESTSQHDDLLKALAARDPVATADVMRLHILQAPHLTA